eukprot:CAMPEP_0183319516 /NCGR_PEP_ID=MMETSP0160_2-20130417/63873_1 /TAXON_ID=2839 ORGANISM="Odontella Sinensis, Strain Grunow 1884" /NCGR_SAMPLE_ID=MMETSP0160_2 /ASSEMBLY_ACC=CAM_ASM_000250 /LENGTH=68 /DNA_ID=CAMNT_0025486015 /DNA_START=14 /DNA_END=216 /DNA_ORIENTATION=+
MTTLVWHIFSSGWARDGKRQGLLALFMELSKDSEQDLFPYPMGLLLLEQAEGETTRQSFLTFARKSRL